MERTDEYDIVIEEMSNIGIRPNVAEILIAIGLELSASWNELNVSQPVRVVYRGDDGQVLERWIDPDEEPELEYA
jgi:hypothetical protein